MCSTIAIFTNDINRPATVIIEGDAGVIEGCRGRRLPCGRWLCPHSRAADDMILGNENGLFKSHCALDEIGLTARYREYVLAFRATGLGASSNIAFMDFLGRRRT